ncbi:hypothetical protein SODALDRAFT_331118 [Sodiomyces alkalinus F11]|uniref:Uncharacterized protein n=1 Tax=Sodiomyces alkalinus (strain CBS 110278 / VKM F-3762 / F11) TaxID=1314773 RepID=A0A3N2Q3Z5_SODAK|nr:hypothetical protein SODALDRAFT_331118 [Sodiomyces alkalinus F11]ROT41398.1 hypothetical protein SODALDRAFT_331118 [Sodiomyces alkalinus F11]
MPPTQSVCSIIGQRHLHLINGADSLKKHKTFSRWFRNHDSVGSDPQSFSLMRLEFS